MSRALARLMPRAPILLEFGDRGAPGPEGVAHWRDVGVDRERHLQCMAVDRPQLGQRQPDDLDGPQILLGQSEVRDRRVVCAQGDRHAGPPKSGQRMVRDRRHDPGMGVGGRTEIQGHVPRDEFGAQARIIHRARSVRDSLRVHGEGPPDLRGAAPLARVEGDAQAAGASRLEGHAVEAGIGEGRLGSREVPAGQPLVAEPRGGLGQDHVCRRVVRAQRRADEPHDCPGSRSGGFGPSTDRRDAVGQ